MRAHDSMMDVSLYWSVVGARRDCAGLHCASYRIEQHDIEMSVTMRRVPTDALRLVRRGYNHARYCYTSGANVQDDINSVDQQLCEL